MYTVVRCPSCERCWGVMGKARKCPHCGIQVGDDLFIVSVVDTASELQREVAIANMPENLRDEMREKLPKNDLKLIYFGAIVHFKRRGCGAVRLFFF